MRRALAIPCNLLVPGCGLIVLRREWLGLAVAALYGLLGEVVLLGTLIVPGTVPAWVTTACVTGAVLVWLGAQWRLFVGLRAADGPALVRELAILRQQAADAAVNGAYDQACDILRVALALNDEDLACNIQWAELMTLMGRFREARRGWRRVEQLDHGKQHHRAALEALATLPEG